MPNLMPVPHLSFVLQVNTHTGEVREIKGHAKRAAFVALAYKEEPVGRRNDFGGMIVCSIGVNAAGYKGTFSGIKNWAAGLLNRLFRPKRVENELLKTLTEWNRIDQRKIVDTGWSLGNLFRGRYVSAPDKETGKREVFNEKSFTIDIRGVPLDFVKEVGAALAKKFMQESVLIVDHKTNHTVLLKP